MVAKHTYLNLFEHNIFMSKVLIKNIKGIRGISHKGRGLAYIIEKGKPLVSLVNESEIRRVIDHNRDRIEIVDGKGGILIPGYYNTHYHSTNALLEGINISYSAFGKRTKEELLKAIQSDAESRKTEKIIVVFGLNTNEITDLNKEDLDRIESNKPIILFDPSYHGAVVNSRALEIIRRKAEEKEKRLKRKIIGICGKDGKLTEDYVFLTFALVDDVFGKEKEVIEKEAGAIVEWLKKQVRNGITSMDDMISMTLIHTMAVIRAEQIWANEMNVAYPIRRLYIRPEVVEEIRSDKEAIKIIQPWIEQNRIGIKLLADGSIGTFTARLSRPYIGSNNRGVIFDTYERIYLSIKRGIELGINSVRMHGIGDEGIRHAIRTIEQIKKAFGTYISDVGIEHFEISGYSDIITNVRDNGIIISLQPNFSEDMIHYEVRLGDERISHINPLNDILREGIPVSFGDDGMPPGIGVIHNATHHPNPEQRIDLETALKISSGELIKSGNEIERGNYLIVTDKLIDMLDSNGKTEEEIKKEMSSIWNREYSKEIMYIILSGGSIITKVQ